MRSMSINTRGPCDISAAQCCLESSSHVKHRLIGTLKIAIENDMLPAVIFATLSEKGTDVISRILHHLLWILEFFEKGQGWDKRAYKGAQYNSFTVHFVTWALLLFSPGETNVLTLQRKPPGLAQQLATHFKQLGLTQLSKIKLIQLFSHSWWQGYFHLLPVVFLLSNLEEISFSLRNNPGPSWGTKGTFQGGGGAWLPTCLGVHPFTGVSLSFCPVGLWRFILGWFFSFSPCHPLQVVSCVAAVLCLIFSTYPRGGCRTAGLSAAPGC